jgi:hypothetical protein
VSGPKAFEAQPCSYPTLCEPRYVDIGPVNKVLNMLCCYLEKPDGDAFKKHLPRIKDYLWVAEDGMKMQGYNGSQVRHRVADRS